MSENPFSKRMRKQCTGTKAEKGTAKRLGATLTPASGALEGAKGDMHRGTILMENKSTIKGSMSLKLDWLIKISQEALEKGQTPALALQFTTESGVPVKRGAWVMVPEAVFNEMLGE